MGLLTPDMLGLLEMGVAHQVGGCTRAGRPVLCRGLAGHADSDGRLAVILSGESGFEVIAAVRDTGLVAVNFTLPSTYRSLLVKGQDAVVSADGVRFLDLVRKRHRAFRDQLTPFGFPPAYTGAWYEIPDGDLHVIRFKPTGAWNQTPGPGAGNPLELASPPRPSA
jgi:hypothetical protein